MSILVVLVAAVALGVAGLVALARLASFPREWSDEEYERRRRARGSGLLGASMRTLAEEIDPGGKRAAEERAALERGGYEEVQGAVEPPGPDSSRRVPTRAASEATGGGSGGEPAAWGWSILCTPPGPEGRRPR